MASAAIVGDGPGDLNAALVENGQEVVLFGDDKTRCTSPSSTTTWGLREFPVGTSKTGTPAQGLTFAPDSPGGPIVLGGHHRPQPGGKRHCRYQADAPDERAHNLHGNQLTVDNGADRLVR